VSEIEVYITHTAIYLPNQPVDNDNIESVLGMVGGKPSRAKRIILKRNGIEQRYYVLDPKTGEPQYTNAQITANAVRGLFKDDNGLNNIECLVSGTTMPDQIAPNHAVMVHGELKMPACEVIATSGICLSGMTALKYAYMAVKSGEHEHVVSTGSETASIMLRASKYEEEAQYKVAELQKKPEIGFEKDFLRWLLSDGAGAFLIESTPVARGDQPVLKINWLEMFSYAHEYETCMYAGAEKEKTGELKGWNVHENQELLDNSVLTLKQDVKLLNEHIVPVTLIRSLQTIIKKRQLRADKIDYFLPHISSMYFYDKVVEALDEIDFHIPQDKWFTNLKNKGNTGSASIYIMLDELLKSGKIKSGDNILCFIPESGRFSSAFLMLTAL
jgi:3-oxoacyl-[acyl-carrier-protein] synthase-3